MCLPSKFYPGPMLLNVSVRMTTGVSNMATVLANYFVVILYGGTDGEGGKHAGPEGVK